jgi:hypothetical protein
MSPILPDSAVALLGGAPARLKADLNASLGAVAAFFGFVALTFAVLLVLFIAVPFQPVFTISTLSAGFAAMGILAGRRAPRVTTRNLRLAKAGYLASVVALAGCVVALVVSAIRALA